MTISNVTRVDQASRTSVGVPSGRRSEIPADAPGRPLTFYTNLKNAVVLATKITKLSHKGHNDHEDKNSLSFLVISWLILVSCGEGPSCQRRDRAIADALMMRTSISCQLPFRRVHICDTNETAWAI